MKRRLWNPSRSAAYLAAFALVPAAIAGCGDDDNGNSDADTPLFDSGSFPDADTFNTDTGTPIDTFVGTDTTPPPDTTPPDLVPDLDPPVIVSTFPAADTDDVQLPFVVSVTFNEPVYAPTIATQTIQLVDNRGNQLPGKICVADTECAAADGQMSQGSCAQLATGERRCKPFLKQDQATASFTPDATLLALATPYAVRVVGNIITDVAGNKYIASEDFWFTTANFPNQEKFREVAARYAPDIKSGVDGGTAQTQVPTKFDIDGDWDMSNNRDYLNTTATQIVPAIYYTVAETKTHYYITYLYYFPWVNHSQPAFTHGNGTNGIVITVEKARGGQAERPIAVHTYFKENDKEENFAYVTEESGIAPGNNFQSDWRVMNRFPQAELFPNNRFTSWISAKDHQSCAYIDEPSGVLPKCELSDFIRNGDHLAFAYNNGAPTPVTKVGGTSWPKNMAEAGVTSFGYALIPTLTTLWPRRWETGNSAIYEITTYTYEADGGRPGPPSDLTSKIVDSLGNNFTAYGRPPWSWDFDPAIGSGSNGGFANITQGQINLDPSWYMWERHRPLATNSMMEYDAAAGTGWSHDYCFNGYLYIDIRGTDPACPQ